jgi:hypothetical protein
LPAAIPHNPPHDAKEPPAMLTDELRAMPLPDELPDDVARALATDGYPWPSEVRPGRSVQVYPSESRAKALWREAVRLIRASQRGAAEEGGTAALKAAPSPSSIPAP